MAGFCCEDFFFFNKGVLSNLQKRRGTTVRHKQKDQTRTYLQVGEMLSRINGRRVPEYHGVEARGVGGSGMRERAESMWLIMIVMKMLMKHKATQRWVLSTF